MVTLKDGCRSRLFGAWLHIEKRMLVPFKMLLSESSKSTENQHRGVFHVDDSGQLIVQSSRWNKWPTDGDHTVRSGCQSPWDGADNLANVQLTGVENLNWTTRQTMKWASEMVIVARPEVGVRSPLKA